MNLHRPKKDESADNEERGPGGELAVKDNAEEDGPEKGGDLVETSRERGGDWIVG